MSDILARNVFKDRKACEYVLRIIMDDEARMDEKKDVAYSLADRKMSVEDISEIIKVNIETVRGWLAGRTPAKNSNRIPSYRSRKQKCPVWGDFYIPKNKTEALNEHTTINLDRRNRKMQQHFPRGRVSLCFAACSVPADPESGKGIGILRISQDKKRTGAYRKRESFLPKSAKNAGRLESF